MPSAGGANASREGASANRWSIALAGVIMQIAFGAVYAWSVFRIPLSKNFGWTITQVMFTFALSILMLGFASFVGGEPAFGNARAPTAKPLSLFHILC